MSLTQSELQCLSSVRAKIVDLQKQQEDLYQTAIKSAGLEDNDWIWDYMFNGCELPEGFPTKRQRSEP